jgi:hypothetical protein
MSRTPRSRRIVALSAACAIVFALALYLTQHNLVQPDATPMAAPTSAESIAAPSPQQVDLKRISQAASSPALSMSEPQEGEPENPGAPSAAVRARVRAAIEMELRVVRPQLEQSTARAGVGTQEYLQFLQDKLV